MNTQPNSQPAKKLTLKKESVRLLTNEQPGQGFYPTVSIWLSCISCLNCL
jgi:hypothetical protein